MHTIVNLRLHYFPFPGRAGAIRDTLHIGGVAFEDVHIPPEKFHELKATDELPFGALPVLEVETAAGKMRVAQSNAILRFAGRLAGLYPMDDAVQALKVDEALDLGEEINDLLGPSLHEQDTERKMAMRKVLAEETLPRWLGYFERLLVANGGTGFIVGDSLSVADLKLYWICDFLTNGSLDGIPTTLLDNFKTVIDWYKNIAAVRKSRLGEVK
jgi:glutathione S-transferase